MNLYSRDFYDDDALIAEIREHARCKRELAKGGSIAVIAGENRRVEFVRSNTGQLDTDLREMMYEARQRGLSIGGDPETAITVEIG
jgi:hypothetical protein